MKSVALLNRSAVTMQRDHDDISKEGQKNETLISFLRINPEVPLLLVSTSINVWTEREVRTWVQHLNIFLFCYQILCPWYWRIALKIG